MHAFPALAAARRAGLLSLSSTDRRFMLHVEVELASEARAKELLSQLDLPAVVASVAGKDEPVPDLGKHKRWSEGTRVFYEVSVDDDMGQQSRVLAALSALGIYG